MKKTLALILCLIMVAAVAVSAISAEETKLIDARELQAYGQVHYYLGNPVAPTEVPNATDGKVNENEYVVTFQYHPYGEGEELYTHVTDSKTGTYTDTEWVKLYLSHDGEKLYLALEVKDKAYYPDKDYFMINIGARDAGTTVKSIDRIRYDVRGDASTLLTGDALNTAVGTFWKNDDGSWGTAPAVEFNDHVSDRSMLWDAERGILTLELVFDIQAILDYWENDQAIEDARLYFYPIVKMRGDSAEGAGDGPLDQGHLWHYLRSNVDPKLKMQFAIDYPEISYYMDMFGEIIHFCEKPAETTPPPTEPTTPTEKPTVPTLPPTVPKTTTVAPTDAPKDDASKATDAPKEEEKGCGSVVALSALAIVPMLGAAVVFGKKKED